MLDEKAGFYWTDQNTKLKNLDCMGVACLAFLLVAMRKASSYIIASKISKLTSVSSFQTLFFFITSLYSFNQGV